MPLEQALLYGVTIVILAGTLIVSVAQYVRMNRRDKRDEDDHDDSEQGAGGS